MCLQSPRPHSRKHESKKSDKTKVRTGSSSGWRKHLSSERSALSVARDRLYRVLSPALSRRSEHLESHKKGFYRIFFKHYHTCNQHFHGEPLTQLCEPRIVLALWSHVMRSRCTCLKELILLYLFIPKTLGVCLPESFFSPGLSFHHCDAKTCIKSQMR